MTEPQREAWFDRGMKALAGINASIERCHAICDEHDAFLARQDEYIARLEAVQPEAKTGAVQ